MVRRLPSLRGWRVRWSRIALAVLALVVLAGAALDYASWPPPLPDYAAVRAAWRPSESWLYDRNGTLIDSARVNFQARRLAWTGVDAVAKPARQALVAAEDKRFRSHRGVDWWAIAGAVRDRIEGRRSRGASTLSMQVAAYLSPDLAAPGSRGMLDKVRQMRAARALEDRWSKDEILEAYLNLAGFRGEAQGIGAAALSLFGKTPQALSKEEGELLAALLPDPGADAPAVAARACALAGAADCGRFEATAASMLGPARSLALDPGLAPHLATRLLKKPGMRVTTTLDARIQQIATTALARQLEGLGERARDGAVIVADNASGEVRAYVGGAGSNSTAPAVDGADSYRQAGSTLKPFLYADAIEKGYLTPASILDDSPVQLDTATGLYAPQNYDHEFKGPVSARIALAGSLNVPAVRTLLLVGVEAFRDRLWDTGYRGLTEDGEYYGFSLALGSAEVTLMQQVAAYRSLERGGRWSPLKLVKLDTPNRPCEERSDAAVQPGTRRSGSLRCARDDEVGSKLEHDSLKEEPRAITSPQAAWIVGDMLSDPNARVATFGLDNALRLPFWAAVKTGTSKAMRDNWCIGFSDRYTVGVWVGNKEGDPMRAVSGTSGAAPVWRDVMLAIHKDGAGHQPPRPDGIEQRRVRFAGGAEQPRRDYFLAGTGQARVALAPASARRPHIVSPVSGSVYALDPDIPIDRQRLSVSVAGQAVGHRLELDKRDLGGADTKPLVLAGPGRHRLRLIDLGGKVVDQVRFTVR